MSIAELLKQWRVNGGTPLTQAQASQLLQQIDIPLNPSTRRPGIELRIALEQDPIFGPVIAFSYGRMAMDVWEDVAYRIVPLTPKDARLIVGEPKAASRLLGGYGSAKAPDAARIAQAILKLSELAQANPEIAEIDLDPVLALPDGLVAKGARITLAGAKGS
ncbi:MAG: acetate--CoA ligase family protein [Chloroflexi bacterium]|nr:acetate--CoA ligase family protein [Chloroflexota bacterium]MBI4198175.1 acetate--CoA ligase family protein [Chloroflexota bacterium]